MTNSTMKLVVIFGTHGQLFIDHDTGEILKRKFPCDCDECEGIAYAEIDKFNMDDLTRDIYWDEDGIGWLDVLYIGHTINNGDYENPIEPIVFTFKGDN